MLEDIKYIHMVGAGGIGMAAVAKLLLAKGKSVSGSDLTPSPLTHDLARRGLKFHSGHAVTNVPDEVELVIYSAAIPEQNVERARAVELGVPQLSYAEFLGALSKEYSTIAVTGTNGKSTTTAMLGLILEAAGYDPTVIVGSLVPTWPLGNLRIGSGRFLVVEACEYRAHMLHLEPEMIVLTNIEEDHLDYYRDIDHIRETFQTFVDKLAGKGIAVTNANDPESVKLKIDRGVTYGFETAADYVGQDRNIKKGIQTCSVKRSELLGELTLQVPGLFNVMNALAATAAAMELGVPFETCAHVLSDFRGTWRRFERVGTWKGADIISDYGHHPTAISGTIEAARELFPDRRIVLCFQPHQHSRTKTLLAELVEAVAAADLIVIPEIYKVVGRTEKEEKEVSSHDIVAGVKKNNATKEIHYAADLIEAESILRDIVRKGDVVIVQGAGDVDAVARKLAA